jgi:transcriptional regulator with XRE-family HTH domain
VSTKSSLIRKLKKSKEYRDAFVDSEISVGLPFQIRALREQRTWSQKELAEATSMLQPRICAMEQAGYGNFTLNTLKKLAAAFDVGLVVRFAPFGEMVNWADNFSPDTFSVPSSKDDPVLVHGGNRADIRSGQSVSSTIMAQAEQVIKNSSLFREAAAVGNSSDYSQSFERANVPLSGGAEIAATALRRYA